ncbi:MAG: HAD-IIB family hydrolase [Clostridia bacterium]|nr:HAD-IIB family hydrolase [Clostridia bacterium]
MGLFDGCLLACDIDGTLLLSDYLPQCNLDKIKYFVSEGGAFSLATGRTAGAISTVTSRIPNIAPSIVANGSMIYDIQNDKALYEIFLPDEDKCIVKAVLDSCKTVGIEIHSGKQVLVVNQNQETIDHENYENLTALTLDYEAALGYNWNKVLYLFSNQDEANNVKQIISNIKHNSQFIDTSAVIDGRRRYYYEHVPKNISKASSLKLLCEILNIKKGCCFSIGDYYNDLEMIATADVGAALVDSPDAVKAAATTVVCEAKNGAVADFIDYLTERKNKNGFKL